MVQPLLGPASDSPVRLRLTIEGAVQGVGFRPFLLRLATELGLVGCVRNTTSGVLVEIEGPAAPLETFMLRLQRERPPHAVIQTLDSTTLEPIGERTFRIGRSNPAGTKRAVILPDYATCTECLQEISDPGNRRYRYPFTNCTHCGPRFSILEALPYDRPNTTMRRFAMCPACRAEYEDPGNRRFHAQPNACPACGPHLELWDAKGQILAKHHPALEEAADSLRRGGIVALKGLGGFHLLVDARRDEAVRALRQCKGRLGKPLAVLCPTLDLARHLCAVSAEEAALLASPQSPIVLLRRRPACFREIAPAVAPDNPWLGIMLPYTPLHHLLLAELGFPVVATSGNVAEEPICIDEHEARERLANCADFFLVHNRPIARHVDDSVVRVLLGQPQLLRRARGYAPLPIHLARPVPSLFAVGAHQKNTVAVSFDRAIVVSQHLGDLETAQAFAAFQEVGNSLQQMYDLEPVAVACDLHPDYLSTQFACRTGLPIVRVQHHYAHVLACMAEHGLEGTALGISWDGTGYGTDQTIWGGEFLRVRAHGFERVAHLRNFGLPGGAQAVRQPWRAALGLLYELFGDELFALGMLPPLEEMAPSERAMLQTMLRKRIHTPRTSSAGRLFDAVAVLLGLPERVQFEGQAAMALEFALGGTSSEEQYDIAITESPSGSSHAALRVDWEPLIRAILHDLRHGVARGPIATRFHNTLVEAMVRVASRVGEERVLLTGGCFQNGYLTERAVHRLRRAGFTVYWHQQIPPNDGGIAVGQILAAARELEEEPEHVPGRSRKTLEH